MILPYIGYTSHESLCKEISTFESSIATNMNTSSTDDISDTVSQLSSVETTDTTETADLTELVSFVESDLPIFSDDPDINHQYFVNVKSLALTKV